MANYTARLDSSKQNILDSKSSIGEIEWKNQNRKELPATGIEGERAGDQNKERVRTEDRFVGCKCTLG